MVVAGAFVGLPLAVSLRPGRALAQLGSAAPSGTVDVFVAESIPVDVTAGSVGEARERGLVQGRIAGFRKIVERLVAREDLSRVPQVGANQIIDMVREFSIANERSSAVRYLADLTVRFNPNAVRQLLRDADVPFTETVSKPLVVLPVLVSGGTETLWGGTNPWHDAWLRTPPDGGLLPLIVPPGDAEDAAQVSAAQAAMPDVMALATLAERYRAGGVLVAAARFDGEGPATITLTEVRPSAAPLSLSVTHTGAPNQPMPEVIAEAVETATAAAADNWRRRNRVFFGVESQMTALVPVSDLNDWLGIRGRLVNVALIEQVDIQAMTRDRVQIILRFAGDEEQLRFAMGQHDLNLSQQDGVWVIENVHVDPIGRMLEQPDAVAVPPPAENGR